MTSESNSLENYSQEKINKSRFLQRDGKPLSERPFTIAFDKPEEISLEDIERYDQSNIAYQSGEQIDQSSSELNSASTFFCSLEDNSGDRIHPDHKIYRGTRLKNVLFKAGKGLQGLRMTLSTETLESAETGGDKKGRKKRGKCKGLRLSRESSTDVDEPVQGFSEGDSLYYKQGSSGLGARIAQADYADPSVLFGHYFEGKVGEKKGGDDSGKEREFLNEKNGKEREFLNEKNEKERDFLNGKEREFLNEKNGKEREFLNEKNGKEREFLNKEFDRKESDCFYEKDFETIENCEGLDHHEGRDERDSAIFSDDEGVLKGFKGKKVPPPVPVKRGFSKGVGGKPSIAVKPESLKLRSRVIRKGEGGGKGVVRVKMVGVDKGEGLKDISAGQSQAGWVKKMVGQLQGDS